MAYNGWSNRATWNVSLWLNNDESTYKELCRIQRHADDEEELAERIEAFCRLSWPNGKTPDGDKLSEADFEEIAASEWVEEDHPAKSYEEAAQRFGITFNCTQVARRPDGMMEENYITRHFHCKIKCGKRSFGLYFSQGSAFTQPPTLADVLNAIASDAQSYENARDFADWGSWYGCDTDSRKAKKIYKAVKRQAEQLKRTIGEEAYKVILEDCERL